MRVVIQRVSTANVQILNKTVGEIATGLVVFLGIISDDTQEDVDWLVNKIINLRIFPDNTGVMNRSLLDISGDILLVSQFTLHAKTRKGNRPSYYLAANPNIAIPLYELFIHKCNSVLPKPVQTGIFGANMGVFLCNDGPVTIIIDSKNKYL
ncbi:MAG: D-tyrosyl-tRNA(Tyr) deacylase [Bacteroidales bacterium]|nr:D-tyrosyl-tRNA(Tyr) deacylase [Bacteroidales bacterium]HQP03435.1 D-aminoacyl-tRNA deacylase [Bacteroidales bacterium]